MTNIRQFEDIEAWKQGRELAAGIYAVTGKGEFAKDYGLRDQIRRAAQELEKDLEVEWVTSDNRE